MPNKKKARPERQPRVIPRALSRHVSRELDRLDRRKSGDLSRKGSTSANSPKKVARRATHCPYPPCPAAPPAAEPAWDSLDAATELEARLLVELDARHALLGERFAEANGPDVRVEAEAAIAAAAAADPGLPGFGDMPAACHAHIWIKQLFDVLRILFGKPLGAGWGLSWMLERVQRDVQDNPGTTDGGDDAGAGGEVHGGGNGGVAETASPTVTPNPQPAFAEGIKLMCAGIVAELGHFDPNTIDPEKLELIEVYVSVIDDSPYSDLPALGQGVGDRGRRHMGPLASLLRWTQAVIGLYLIGVYNDPDMILILPLLPYRHAIAVLEARIEAARADVVACNGELDAIETMQYRCEEWERLRPKVRSPFEYVRVTEAELLTVSASLRGKLSLDGINTVYRGLHDHFRPIKSRALTPVNIDAGGMDRLGLQVAGAAGAATLKVLRQLGLITMSNRENNYLVDVYIVGMRYGDDGDHDGANDGGRPWTQGSTR